jgi:hypothetical protein
MILSIFLYLVSFVTVVPAQPTLPLDPGEPSIIVTSYHGKVVR